MKIGIIVTLTRFGNGTIHQIHPRRKINPHRAPSFLGEQDFTDRTHPAGSSVTDQTSDFTRTSQTSIACHAERILEGMRR
jgi:hypothetical protein